MRIISLLFIIGMFHFTARTQTFAWAGSFGGQVGSFIPNDRGNSIKCDVNGNVFTTGTFAGTVDFNPGIGVTNLTAMNGSSLGTDMFIQKLDANGNFLWAKQLVGDSSSAGYGVVINASSNVYITGYFRGTKDFDPGPGVYNLVSLGNADIFILKLDANGNFIWAKSTGGASNEGGFGISLDSSDNLYTIGKFQGTADFDPGPNAYNLAATSTSINGYDAFILKVNGNGDFVWAKQISGSGFCNINAILTDGSNNNIILTGSFSGTIDFDPGVGVANYSTAGTDIFVEKLEMNGNFIWAKQMVGNLASYGYGIAVDSAGNIFYNGTFWGTVDFDPGPGLSNLTSISSSRDIFISKLDALGDLIWIKQIGASDDQEAFSIALDQFANVYSTGFFQGTVDFDPGPSVNNLIANVGGSYGGNVYIEKLDSTGNFIWAGSMSGASSAQGRAITLNNSGDIYCTGEFWGTLDFDPGSGVYNLTSNGSSDIFITKLTQGSVVTGIVNPDNQFQIRVTPNPSNGEFYLTAKGVINKVIKVDIIDILGRMIYTDQRIANSNDYSQLLNLKKPAAGIYDIKITINKKVYSRKIIKTN